MKSVGIISEYNPFHNGHRYQAEKARELSGADCVIAVISGNFVQRGEVAAFSKYERAKIAVENGIDMVVELPAYFSLQSAEGFAQGGVKILDALCCDGISFGCETDNLSLLKETASLLKNESADFKKVLKEKLKEGKSFASSRCEAFSKISPDSASVIMKPNNILAVEYISAARKIGSKMEFYPVKRVGTEHDSNEENASFSSASHIRNLLKNKKDIEKFTPCVPSSHMMFTEDFEKLILYSIYSSSEEALMSVAGSGDGLCQRIMSFQGNSYGELLEYVKTKRFALSRIKRYIINLLIGNNLPEKLSPTYLRPLALNEKGAAYIKENINNFSLPLYTKPSKIPSDDIIFNLERRSSRICSVIYEKTKDDIYMSPLFKKM